MTLMFKCLKFNNSFWKFSIHIFLIEQMANLNRQCWIPNSQDKSSNKGHTAGAQNEDRRM